MNVEKFTFAISSPDEFFYCLLIEFCRFEIHEHFTKRKHRKWRTLGARLPFAVNCTALLQTSQLGCGVDAITCVKCNSWNNDELLDGQTCEQNPPRPVSCRPQTPSTKCMISTDYAADGPFHIWRILDATNVDYRLMYFHSDRSNAITH